MGRITRFGISLDEELLAAFDALCHERGWGNRSEAFRHLIRMALNDEQWDESAFCGGSLTLVYDHHRHDLARRLMDIQHEYHDIIVSTLHVHLDHNNCMECLALQGKPDAVRQLAQKLISCKGVAYGAFNRAPSAKDLH